MSPRRRMRRAAAVWILVAIALLIGASVRSELTRLVVLLYLGAAAFVALFASGILVQDGWWGVRWRWRLALRRIPRAVQWAIFGAEAAGLGILMATAPVRVASLELGRILAITTLPFVALAFPRAILGVRRRLWLGIVVLGVGITVAHAFRERRFDIEALVYGPGDGIREARRRIAVLAVAMDARSASNARWAWSEERW